MLLEFPNQPNLTLALNRGLVPDEVVMGTVRVAVAEAGTIWLETSETIARSALSALKDWGVAARRSTGAQKLKFVEYTNWLQCLPLCPAEFRVPDEKTVVLFELATPRALPDFVNEILRQGNDRLSYRALTREELVAAPSESSSAEEASDLTILLRVIGPPYYSLLRALESDDQDILRAFVEIRPRVWCQIGSQHTLAERIAPAPNQHLLLSPPDTWRTIEEKPFHDIYPLFKYELPRERQTLADTNYQRTLPVPLRLSRGGVHDIPTLYVLRDQAVDQIDQFVKSSNDELLERLSFSVCTSSRDKEIVVLRVRPGRTAPPALVFDAVAYRSYLKIPNLYVPVGQRIHPPLRRDALHKLLADDDSSLHWLEPIEDNSTSTQLPFVPCSVSDSSFRPLSHWVDYIVDRDRETMQTWTQSHEFDFEAFQCSDEKARPTKRKPPPRRPAPTEPGIPLEDHNEPVVTGADSKAAKKRAVKKLNVARKPTPKQQEIERLEKQLSQLEGEFLKAEDALDAPIRGPMWRAMAELENRLERFKNAGILLQHTIWDSEGGEPADVALWLETTLLHASANNTIEIADENGEIRPAKLGKLLRNASPTPTELTQLCAAITLAHAADFDQSILKKSVAELQSFLSKHEKLLGVRARWLAWWSLSSITDDVLMLARARDRLLLDLFEQGLASDRDVPAFLRMDGSQAGARLRTICEVISQLEPRVLQWSESNLQFASKKTLGYINLIFSFGYARLGETSRAQDLLQEGRERLSKPQDPVHAWLSGAFAERIQGALAGQVTPGPLPDVWLERLESLERLDRYKVDRLRQHSSILEPHERLDPYRKWRGRRADNFQHQLSELFDIISPSQLEKQIQQLFSRSLSGEDQARLVATALELTPRIHEEFALEVLDRVPAAEGEVEELLLRASLLEKALTIAAHYAQEKHVHELLLRLQTLIDEQNPEDLSSFKALESLLFHSFKGLRKLGMRDAISDLLHRLNSRIQIKSKRKKPEPERLQVLMQLAGAWFYFGDDRGREDLDQVREVLLSNELIREGHVGAKKQTDLAISYIGAAGQTPIEEASQRLGELFESLEGIHDSATINSHYSLKQLDIVESLVQTVVGDGFATNSENQKWLDEEEYIIRRRIHRDVRAKL